MGRPSPATRSAERATVAQTAADLAALGRMTGAQLAEKYLSLFGAPTRTRNTQYLRKRLAWRIQELAEGGLSPRALARIEELVAHAPERWKRVLDPMAPGKPSTSACRTGTGPVRDARLPSPGTVITRSHAGVEHRITVLVDGFEYQGERYRSLSKIARLITGTPWNGFLFFFGRGNGTRKASAGGAT